VVWWLATALCGVMWLIGAYRNSRSEADPWFAAAILCGTGGMVCLAIIKCWKQGHGALSCCPRTVHAHQQDLLDRQLERQRLSGELVLQSILDQDLVPNIATVVLQYLGTSPSSNLVPTQ
jgi:hypothetical protein